MAPELVFPDWPAPPNVRAIQTTRAGGFSQGPFAAFNLGDHVGDVPASVAANRALLKRAVPAPPLWLRQVHGTQVVDAAKASEADEADAAYAKVPGRVCVVMTADCLPILLCDRKGSIVAAVHAGWRGLCAGIVERTVSAMGVPGGGLLAWLGPAIGPAAFEVGCDVRDAFLAGDAEAAAAFCPHGSGKWMADIFLLARQRLATVGVSEVWGGGECTALAPARYFSHRREGVTGRMATLVWLAPETV